ncbi:MAG: Holliday junction branch migration protein RuvA [Clostridia bacterium]|nr:Holliday junction branch migration protein RuvA [Clostridia bacterium]MBQ6468036.1 Holliday junction branch migration protein RuvA [Clostridia bacterium]MBR6334720.1 Holliday junction branch migration protein RuvA [Clostridia bacterium]
MFYSITGKIVYTGENAIAVDCSGVAFYLTVSANTLRKCGDVGDTQTLFTYLSVREDALDLFGFADKAELDCYKLLTGISGVGPKAAIAILSALTPDALALAVAGDDAKSISAAQGIGAKIANRIILELKGKIDSIPVSSGSLGNIAAVKKSALSYAGEDAVNALVMLGYSKSEAGIAVGKLDGNLSTEEMIKQALALLAKNM